MMQRWSDYLEELRDGGKVIRADFQNLRKAT